MQATGIEPRPNRTAGPCPSAPLSLSCASPSVPSLVLPAHRHLPADCPLQWPATQESLVPLIFSFQALILLTTPAGPAQKPILVPKIPMQD